MSLEQRASEAPTRLLLIGAGRMGGALLAGLRGANAPADILVVDPKPPQGPEQAVANLAEIGDFQPNLVVLAVKPGLIATIAPELRRRLSGESAVVSFMAGVRLARLRELLGRQPTLIRVMPNLPMAVGAGVCGLYAPADADVGALERSIALLNCCSLVVRLPREDDLDTVTAISGSGPAYVFRFAEALTLAAVARGLRQPVAAQLARQTLVGAGAQLAADPTSFADMREQVTSPGGTTAQALAVLGAPGGIDDLVTKAVQAAVVRAQALGEQT